MMGSVYKIGRNGSWAYAFKAHGRRFVREGYRTRTAAKKAMTKRQRDLEAGYLERKRFGEAADSYLETYCRQNNSPATQKMKGLFLRRFKEEWGNRFLENISPFDIEKYRRKRLDEGVKHATVNRETACLKNLYTCAVAWGWVLSNPVKRVRPLDEGPLREKWLTEAEFARLFEASNPTLQGIIWIAVNTGMRRGEIMSLNWKSVDLENRMIYVPRPKERRPKHIPINDALLEWFRNMPQERREGRLFRHKSPRRAFDNAARKAGLTGLRFHDLRHTYASWLAMSGIPLHTISDLLGHSTPNLTKRYAHLSPQHRLDAANVAGERARSAGYVLGGQKVTQEKPAKIVEFLRQTTC